ncbi:MAG: tyrosine--tRNA ligase [Patescibacteria group bacterium]|nr:tyrosine--tRNA ligase [Patescibacteria group bacterium]
MSDLLTRGIQSIYPSKEFVEKKIKKGQKLSIYLGIDPTGPNLHLGHAIALKKLAQFQKEGHKIILLFGDFTAMIGDPDKSSTRIPLTRKQVLKNLKNYKKQASKLISFSGKNKAQIKFNSKWLKKMKFEDVLDLASKVTVQQILERDLFDRRIKEGKPVFLHELMYPLMQGYDSVAMDVDGEIGGNDQTFNMLCGRDLMKNIKGKEKFVITMKILEDNQGNKMGKTEGNMVSLSDNAEEMFRKVMSWSDNLILPGFELCSNLSTEEIERVAKRMAQGINPRDLKMKLAYEITKIYYGSKEAQQAQESFINTFQKNKIPEDARELKAKEGDLLIDVLIRNDLVKSKIDFRRLVDNRAITNLDTEEKVKKYESVIKFNSYRIGKKRFCKIIN